VADLLARMCRCMAARLSVIITEPLRQDLIPHVFWIISLAFSSLKEGRIIFQISCDQGPAASPRHVIWVFALSLGQGESHEPWMKSIFEQAIPYPERNFRCCFFNNSLDLGSSFWDMRCSTYGNSNSERLGNDTSGPVELSASPSDLPT
jgi:hypothetical protein